jgi:hypothetical protein
MFFLNVTGFSSYALAFTLDFGLKLVNFVLKLLYSMSERGNGGSMGLVDHVSQVNRGRRVRGTGRIMLDGVYFFAHGNKIYIYSIK